MVCSQKSAFTVVELLVVIGVISVLAALLLPTLERSLDASRQLACMGQFRQIGLMANLYAEENRESFPTRRNMTFSLFTTYYPRALFAPYGMDDALLACPGAAAGLSSQGNYLYAGGGYDPALVGAAVRMKMGICNMKRTDLDRPDRWAISLDILIPTDGSVLAEGHPTFPLVAFGTEYRSNHRAGLNMARADGSVRWTLRDECAKAGGITTNGNLNHLWPREVPIHGFYQAGFANPTYYWENRDGRGRDIVSDLDGVRIARNFGAH